MKLQVEVSHIEVRISHTELKELKDFIQTSQQYHSQIAKKVEEELKANFAIQQFEKSFGGSSFLDRLSGPLKQVASRVNPFAPHQAEEESKSGNVVFKAIDSEGSDTDSFKDAEDAGGEAAQEVLEVEQKYEEEEA
jgi:hypothetical protein